MPTSRVAVGRFALVAGVVIFSVGTGSGACFVDDLPACPGQCFEYTVAYELPAECLTDMGWNIDIPFNGSAPLGDHGRVCFNSSSIPHVMQAIEHLEGGGQLSDLGMEVRTAYVATVDAVKAELQAQCNTAAPGQCTNAAQVCTGIAADMYEQLVIDETCVLQLAGVEPVALAPGEVCEHGLVEQATDAGEPGEHCTEGTTGRSRSDGADETTGDTGDTGMMVEPFGDLDTLVRCSRPTSCEVDEALVANLSAHLDVLGQERATLTLVGKDAPCGPGLRLGGLDPREHTTALAHAFGLRNGDVVHALEGVALEGMSAAMNAIASLLEDPSTELVVQRAVSSECETLVVAIDVV